MLPYLGGAAALLLFAGALLILHRHAQAYRPSEVRRALRTLEAWQPLAALGLTAASYLLLTLYDVLALYHIGRALPYRRVALASFTGYAFSHVLGFGTLIGPSVRYRIYAPMGLSAGEVGETAGFVIVTFVTGIVAVFPLIALLDPSFLDIVGISRPAGIAIGALGLLLIAAYVGLGWWLERPLRFFGYRFHLPRPGTALAQIALSVADLSLVAAVLYACLPHAGAVGYPHVLAVYVLAFVAGLVSHVPGGLGVFDAVVLVGLSARLPADQILAGLLAFRVIYQLVPLVCAAVLFGAVEAYAARRQLAQAVEHTRLWVEGAGPAVLAGCTFMGGAVLLFSNTMPVSDARLRLVEGVLPLAAVEASHLAGSIAGLLLLLLAHGVQHRLQRAWGFSAALLGGGAVALLMKGFAWEEAMALVLLLLALIPARREFYRWSVPPSQPYAFGWLAAVAMVLAAACWLGLFSYKHLDEVAWQRFAPYDNAARFVRASLAVALVALGAAAYRLVSAATGSSTTE
ncbi:MAG TPA: lysylphosphatidylglycerol synthase domain-containing protein [Stellaceae bacterium]|nr:lysylphosphatidylglycerol synthase domain-containing protein [Stellaceae bacterium]